MPKTPWYKKDLAILPVSHVEIVTMTKNLAVMLEAGLTVPESLEVLVEQTGGRLKKVLSNVNAQVQAGQLLGDALEKAHRVFGPVFISSVRVGESSGTLATNLAYVANQMERELEVRRNIMGALFYPAIIIIATLILGLALATFVLPQMATMFRSLDVELPWTTRVVLWIAQTFQKYGYLITPAIFLVIGGGMVLFTRKWMQPITHRFNLFVPGLKGFVHDINRARFCRTLGTMLQSGVPIQEALKIGSNVMSNYVYRRSVYRMYELIETGEGFSDIVDQFPKLYPKMVQRMIAVGERSGGLADSLLYLARFYEQKVESKAKNLSTIIEPVLLIFIGLGVGFVALSIFTPIYSVTEGLSF